MPYTLKTNQISVKDPETGEYSGVDILAEQTEQGLIAELQAEGTTQVNRINQAAVDVQSAVDKAETDAAKIISDTQTSVNALEAQKNTIAQTVASMAKLGTDTTLSTPGMAADAGAVGDLSRQLSDVESALNHTLEQSPVNIINFDRLIHGAYINSQNGNVTIGTSGTGLNCCTDFLPVEPNTIYYLNIANESGNLVNINEYNSNQEWIKSDGVHSSTDVNEITTTPTTAFIRLSFVSNVTTYRQNILSKIPSFINGETDYKLIKQAYYIAPNLSVDNLITSVRDVDSGMIQSAQTRCTTIVPLLMRKGTTIAQVKEKIGCIIYDLTLSKISAYSFSDMPQKITLDIDAYVHINIAYSDDRAITANDFDYLIKCVNILNPSEATLQNHVNSIVPFVTWRNGSVGNNGNANAIAFKYIAPRLAAKSIKIVNNIALPSGHKYRYLVSTYDVINELTESTQSHRLTADSEFFSSDTLATYTFIDDSIGFALAVFEVNENGVYVPMRVNTTETNDIYFVYQYNDVSNDFVISADFQKKYLVTKRVGKLTNLQAFTFYNGYVYSVKEGTISKQDKSFNAIDSKSALFGHANSIQLGSDSKAYVSGWNDNTVHVVDLDSMDVVDSISLPTTGYTTCAVDDIRRLCYIFQSDTTNTWQPWTFIVYDYVNQKEEYRTKTVPFANIQAVDYWDDRILLMHGLGSDVSPSGMLVFNTLGQVVANYELQTVPSTTEYEGVCFDRETKNIYISDAYSNIYIISTL